MIAVNSLLLQIGKDPSGSIVDKSNSVKELLVVHSAEQICRWTLQFIHNGGAFKKRPPIGIILYVILLSEKL
jgi:hypothetical protein